LFVQMLMSVLYFCFSFRFHHQKQKYLYNLLQYTIGYYNLCGIRSKHSNISKKGGITICVVLDQNHGNVMFYQLVSNLQSMFPSVNVCIVLLKFCFSFRFHHQKQKDLYNLLQYTVFYGLSEIQPGF
jgi:fumarate reductase subunit D